MSPVDRNDSFLNAKVCVWGGGEGGRGGAPGMEFFTTKRHVAMFHTISSPVR